MRRWMPVLVTLVALSVFLAACSSPAGPGTLVAVKGTSQSLDGSDAVWDKAPAIAVKTGVINGTKAPGPVEVKAQAVYSSSDIWFRLEWPDATESIDRSWTFDGTAWKKSGNEDRVGLYWEISPIKQFDNKGCAVLCHNEGEDPSKWYMITPEEKARADNWHWKAARSNPAGYADDKWLTGVLEDLKDLESANHGDQKQAGGDKDNRTEDKKGPAMMQDPGKAPSAGVRFLLASEGVPLDPAKFKAGDKVPAYLLAKPDGSRGDIQAKGVYSNGKWVVVLHRALNTGHEDDVQFNTARTYPFGLAIFDNAGGADHTVSQDPLTLTFK